MLHTFGFDASHIAMPLAKNVTAMVNNSGICGPVLESQFYEVLQRGGHIYGQSTNITQWILTIAALVLLILDNVEFRSEMLVGLLIPLLFLNLPHVLFQFFRGTVGHWISFIVVLAILYTPPVNIPGPTNLWVSIILLLVVAPSVVVHLRFTWYGALISLVIALFLGGQHLADRRSTPAGAFTDTRRLPTTIALILVIAIPIYLFIVFIGWL